jgi:four helix bundle protein
MGDHRKLKVWQEARVLAKSIYLVTRSFPPEEKFGLTMQSRRAAASIMSNLAEGCGRNGDREMLRFVGISQGSASELDSHLTLASDIGMADSAQLSAIQTELSKIRGMLARLAKRLSDGLSDS